MSVEIDSASYNLVFFKYKNIERIGLYLVPLGCGGPSSVDIIQVSSNYINCPLVDEGNHMWVMRPHLYDQTTFEYADFSQEVVIFKYLNPPSLLDKLVHLGVLKRTGIYAPVPKTQPEECKILIPHPSLDKLPEQHIALDNYPYSL